MPISLTSTASAGLVPFLRHRVTRHNRHVAGFTALTIAGAILLWAAAYGATYWLILLFLSATFGGEAHPPAHWRQVFWGISAFLLAFAWFSRRLQPDDRARDARTKTEIAVDFLLLIPRVTLAIWGNLTAWITLSAPELHAAAELLAHVRENTRIPMHAVPLLIPEDKLRDHATHALLLLELAEIRKEDSTLWLKAKYDSTQPPPIPKTPPAPVPSAPLNPSFSGPATRIPQSEPAPHPPAQPMPGELWE